MAEQWYWKHRGDLLGPFDTEVLEDLIRKHRVADQDKIRPVGRNEWLSGAEVKRLFASGGDASTSSEAAARLLSQADRLSPRRHAETVEGEGLLNSSWQRTILVVQGIWGPLAGVGEHISDSLAGGMSRLQVFANRKLTLVVLGILLAAILLRGVNLGGQTQNRRIFEKLTVTFDELLTMRSAGVPGAERRAFQEETGTWLDKTKESLIRQEQRPPLISLDSLPWPGSSHRRGELDAARRELIQAIWAMQKMLQQSPDSIAYADAANDFHDRMTEAQDVLSGKHRERILAAQQNTDQPDSTDALMAGILCLDGVLIIGGLVYWFRRRRT